MSEVNARTLIEFVRQRASGDDPLVLLETAIRVAGEVNGAADEVIEHHVEAALAAGVSWTLIGERLGVSKQAARQMFGHRLGASDITGDHDDAIAKKELADGTAPVHRRHRRFGKSAG